MRLMPWRRCGDGSGVVRFGGRLADWYRTASSALLHRCDSKVECRTRRLNCFEQGCAKDGGLELQQGSESRWLILFIVVMWYQEQELECWGWRFEVKRTEVSGSKAKWKQREEPTTPLSHKPRKRSLSILRFDSHRLCGTGSFPEPFLACRATIPRPPPHFEM